MATLLNTYVNRGPFGYTFRWRNEHNSKLYSRFPEISPYHVYKAMIVYFLGWLFSALESLFYVTYAIFTSLQSADHESIRLKMKIYCICMIHLYVYTNVIFVMVFSILIDSLFYVVELDCG